MGNTSVPNQNKSCSVSPIQTCLGFNNLILDGGELAIHHEVGIPRGKVYPNSLKYLSKNEVQLLYAAGSSNLSSLRWYISLGVNPNTYDENRTSPLHVAARQGSQQVILELISKGASVNLTDVAGWSPLHVSAYYGRAAAIQLLLGHGGDATLINRRGETPWDLGSNEATQLIFAKHCRESELANRQDRPTLPLDLSSMQFADVRGSGDPSPVFEGPSPVLPHPAETLRNCSALYQAGPRVAAECVRLFNTEPFRGLSLLVLLGVVSSEPDAVARFAIGDKRLDRGAIGAILGECTGWYREIAIEFMKLIDFSHLNIVAALKKALTYLVLPEEGSQLNQILQAFGLAYSDQNPNFGSSDSVQSLAFSILMLDSSAAQGKPMRRSKFMRSNEGLKEGQDFPEGVLGWIYDETMRAGVRSTGRPQESAAPFQDLDMRGVITIKGKSKSIGLLDEVLFFFADGSPYALVILSRAEIKENWLTGSVSLKRPGGIPTAKLARDGKVRVKMEPLIQFKSDSIKNWVAVLNACAR